MFRSTTGCLVLHLIYVTVLVVESCTERKLRVVNRRGEVLRGYRKITNARVEVCIDNEWGTICDDYFNIHAARNCCQQLGLPYNYAGGIEEYGGGSGRTYDLYCQNVNKCTYHEDDGCGHSEDTGIRCYEEPECEDGQTRLVTDQVDNVGLVELCVSGLWRSVCSDGWDYRETDILCHELNFNGWSFPVSANQMDVEFHDYVTVRCKGPESELGQCEYEHKSQCHSWGPAGAYCNNKKCDHGATVLVGGRRPYHGRVEYCFEGQWYTLCADDWDISGEEAQVVCQNIVYIRRSIKGSAVIDYYGRGENPILPFSIQCQKSNWELSQCSTSAIDVSQCSQVAGVICETYCHSEACLQCDSGCEDESWCSCSSQCASEGACCKDVSTLNCIERECESGTVRLVGGETDLVGALEVCVSGIWGRVCQYFRAWSYNNSQVICRQLQYSVEGAKFLEDSSFVSSSKRDFILGGVNCVGSETEILQCQHFPFGIHLCDGTGDTPVIQCKERESDCENGEVKLVDGEDSASGYVEICQDGSWGRVCSKKWSINDARVICKQLNYELEDIAEMEQLNCSGNDLVLMGEIHCLGTEYSFTECRRDRRLPNDCQCAKIDCKTAGIVLWSVMAIVPTLGVVTIVTIIFICLYYQYKRKKRLLHKMQQDIMAMPSNNSPQLDHSELTRRSFPVVETVSQQPLDTNSLIEESSNSVQIVDEQLELHYCNKYAIGSILLNREEVIIMEPIGEGVFGVVYKGRLKKSRKVVAVKTINGDFDQLELDSFVEEASKMNTFDHLHVMGIMGFCLDADSAPYLIMSFMENGSLLHYLRREKTVLIPSDDTVPEEVEEISKRLLEMCRQIASGMEYLASMKYVHRDLAARNCMIDAHFTIKVSDFGLSEDVFEKNYLRLDNSEHQGLCLKWMALESLAEGFYSQKSDVWSYGVTIWEIFSGGETPSYSNDTNLSLLRSLQEGKRLPQPHNPACSDESVQLMKQCWEEEAKDRPSFETLHSTFSGFLERKSGYLQLKSDPFVDNTAGTNTKSSK